MNYSIKEFAEKAGVSQSAIYQQLDGRLKPYVITIKGKKRLDAAALREFYEESPQEGENFKEFEANSSENSSFSSRSEADQNENEKKIQANSSQVKSESQVNSSEIELLRSIVQTIQEQLSVKDQQLAAYEEQLANKDKQIADYSERLKEALELTKGQQYIIAADKTVQLMDKENITDDKEIKVAPAADLEEVEQPIKKGWWKNLIDFFS